MPRTSRTSRSSSSQENAESTKRRRQTRSRNSGGEENQYYSEDKASDSLDAEVHEVQRKKAKPHSLNLSDAQQEVLIGDKEGSTSIPDTDNIFGEDWEVEIIAKRAREANPSLAIDEIPASTGGNLSEGMAQQLVASVMRMVLFSNMTKRKVTTKKLRDRVFTPDTVKLPMSSKNAIISIAMHRFKDLFGYDLVCTAHAPILSGEKAKVKSKSKKPAQIHELEKEVRAATESDQWILLNLMADTKSKQVNWATDPDNAQRGLALVVLSCILLKQGAIPEDTLQNLLHREFEIPLPDKKLNEHSGTLLRNLEQEGYVVRRRLTKSKRDGTPSYELSFGPKAVLEIGLNNIWRFAKAASDISVSKKELDGLLSVTAT